MSAILTQYTITGYDASAHLSEETKSAADGAAKGIWRSIFYSAIGGWILLLSFLFAVQDVDGVTKGGGAVATIFTQAMDSKWVGVVLLISTAGQLFCTTACQTSASRMLFAFSRDRAVPGHQLWSKLSAKKVPANAVIVTAGIAAIITLPALVKVDINGAPVPIAFFAVVSIGVVGLYLCFAVPIYYRWKAGDSFPIGTMEPARAPQVDGAARAGRDRHHLDHRDVPDLDRWRALGCQLRVEVRQLHAPAGGRCADPAVDLLARLGEELVHRPHQAGRHHRRRAGGGFLAVRRPHFQARREAGPAPPVPRGRGARFAFSMGYPSGPLAIAPVSTSRIAVRSPRRLPVAGSTPKLSRIPSADPELEFGVGFGGVVGCGFEQLVR